MSRPRPRPAAKNDAADMSGSGSIGREQPVLVTAPNGWRMPLIPARAVVLLAPGLIVLAILLFLPLANIAVESIRPYVPGKIGGARDAPFTLENYAALLHPVYLGYLGTMIWCASAATLLALVTAYPIAYVIARTRTHFIRIALIGLLAGLLFLSALVRVYSLELSFGTVGLGRTIAGLMGVTPNSRSYAEFLVTIGLAHHAIPLSALLMTATIQNINPRLVEAAQALGAPLWRAHLSITIPLSTPGLLSAFLVCYTINLSAFVVPMVLGRGKVHFLSNLVYDRYGELANFPSGSAIAIELLLVTLIVTYGIGWMVQRLVPGGAR
jgi:putative spermidine/putrescine transport system permease protein